MHTKTESNRPTEKRHVKKDGHRIALDASGTSPPASGRPDHAKGHGPLQGRGSRAAVEPVKRLTLTPGEAAAALGVGRTFFFEIVLPELRVIRRGRKRLILVTELVAWAERNAARLSVVTAVT